MTTIQTNTSTTASSTQNSASNSRWDHSGFDQLQQEENSGEWHHVQRPQKKKPAKSSTTDKKTSGGSRKERGGRRGANHKDGNTGNNVLSDEKGSDSLKFEDSHKAKKEKRPDRLLYNPRKNRQEGDGNEGKEKTVRKEKVPSLGLSKENVEMLETPTKIQMSEQEKNSPSNVSTAMSDRQKNFEEETSGMSSQANSQDDGALSESNLLFTMCFETERGLEMVPIYKDERDYEEFLNELCGAQSISSELEALHFKINLLKVIKEMHPEPSRVEECLDKLLDRNYELLTCSQQNDFENFEDAEEESYDFPAGIDWNRNSYINTSSSQSFNLTQTSA
jgi:hypothetical protein